MEPPSGNAVPGVKAGGFDGVDIKVESPSSASLLAYDEALDENIKNWTHAKVKHLLALYKHYRGSFLDSTIRKKDVWQEVAIALNATGGSQFTAAEVDKKWRGLKERYKKIKEASKQKGKSQWPYLADMDSILGSVKPHPLSIVDPPSPVPYMITPNAAAFSAVDSTETISSPASPSSPSTSTYMTPTIHRKRRREDDGEGKEMPLWAVEMMERNSRDNKKMRKQMKKMVKQQKKRNDLFKEFLSLLKGKKEFLNIFRGQDGKK